MKWAFGGEKVAKRGVKGGFFEVFLWDFDTFCYDFDAFFHDFDTFLSRFCREMTVCENCILLIFKY